MKESNNLTLHTDQKMWPHFILLPFTALMLIPALWVIKMAFRPQQSFDLCFHC